MTTGIEVAPAVLEIRQLTVSLPPGAERSQAVRDIGFTVRAGETLCLVGESGSGKSVIAFAAMGLLPATLRPTAGEVLLEGEDILAASEERLRALRCARISIVFQEPMTALNPVMSCGRQIDEVLQQHTALDSAARRARINEILTQVGMREVDRIYASYPHQLSGGQRQRIVIAIAMVLDPVLLIADEPTTALDVTTQAQILNLLRDLQRSRRMAVLFITHDFGVVAEIAHRVAVLRAGELVEIGETEQILSSPVHPYTKMLLAAVPSLTPPMRSSRASAKVVATIDDLSKVYVETGYFQATRTVNAVAHLSLQIRKGEVLGIVGESGSGKSTLARCVARLITPTDGAILLGEVNLAKLSSRALRPFRRHIQIVFQDPYRSLNPRVRVGESIIEGPMNYGLSRTEAVTRARTLLEMVRIDPGALDRYPHEFSGGQRQRICIARALAMEPDLLIADEAVSALDVSVQMQVIQLLDEIRDRLDLTMLFITHDLRVAANICDRVAVMSEGRIVEQGITTEVFANPMHAYTRSLLDAAPGRNRTFG